MGSRRRSHCPLPPSTMRLDPALPWDELFRRCMQSWRDSAARSAARSRYDEACERCFDDPYLVFADAGAWPHWQQHTFADLMIDLRNALTHSYLDTAYAGLTLRDFNWRSGLLPERRIDPVRAEAMQLIDDYVNFIDIWIRHSIERLEDWPARVRTAAMRSQHC